MCMKDEYGNAKKYPLPVAKSQAADRGLSVLIF